MNANQYVTTLEEMPRRRLANRRSWFYSGITVFLLVVVIAGFWPRYFGPLLQEQDG